jgi:hypothetical protein
MQMTPAVEKYVLHWGEMGTRWGTNRTVAQVQALLYLSPKPLRADEIVDLLSVARSNVSTSIRELQSYGLVRMTHILGDRRDYFESLHDVWELFRVIIEQRKQRELNPTLTIPGGRGRTGNRPCHEGTHTQYVGVRRDDQYLVRRYQRHSNKHFDEDHGTGQENHPARQEIASY